MKLVVVESPTKIKTIKKYLPKDYEVIASYGHIKDLPKKDLGIDIEKNFEPSYIISAGKRKVATQLKERFQKAQSLILAVDPDREGEAIGWHVAQLLGVINKNGKIKPSSKKKLARIVFHEITKEAIEKAVENPREINLDLVNAQQARRILDRLVGYNLSPLLWKKIRYGLSAGRVQSVAVRLIVERERERQKFIPEEFWVLETIVFQKPKIRPPYPITIIEKKEANGDIKESKEVPAGCFKLTLVKEDDKKIKIEKKEKIEKIYHEIKNDILQVRTVSAKDSYRSPKPPFTTSTLQQTSFSLFGYSAKKTMQVAQKLYEKGLITYMRTDSTNLSKKAISEVRKFILSNFGQKYLPSTPRFYKTKSKLAQEAHEAIRITKFDFPDRIKIEPSETKLYTLIWQRTISCQMNNAVLKSVTLQALVKNYLFESKGAELIFDGYLKVYKEKLFENILPEVKDGSSLFPLEYKGIQNFTAPPTRYTEASLIKALEKNGIGRPSTYAPTISTILNRGYVDHDGRYLFPTDNGTVVNDLLVKHFPEIVDLKFTAKLEDDLDKIAEGSENWKDFLHSFYTPFKKNLKIKDKEIKKEDIVTLEKTHEQCPICRKAMVIKLGKYGKFLSCSNFPDCKGMKPLETKNTISTKSKKFTVKYEPPPKSKDGKYMILKQGKFGQFWASADYPKVKETAPLLLKEKCPQCGSNLVERQSKWKRKFIGCSAYPKCRFIKKNTKIKIANK